MGSLLRFDGLWLQQNSTEIKVTAAGQRLVMCVWNVDRELTSVFNTQMGDEMWCWRLSDNWLVRRKLSQCGGKPAWRREPLGFLKKECVRYATANNQSEPALDTWKLYSMMEPGLKWGMNYQTNKSVGLWESSAYWRACWVHSSLSITSVKYANKNGIKMQRVSVLENAVLQLYLKALSFLVSTLLFPPILWD